MTVEECSFCDPTSRWTPLALSFQNTLEDVAIQLVSKGVSRDFDIKPPLDYRKCWVHIRSYDGNEEEVRRQLTDHYERIVGMNPLDDESDFSLDDILEKDIENEIDFMRETLHFQPDQPMNSYSKYFSHEFWLQEAIGKNCYKLAAIILRQGISGYIDELRKDIEDSLFVSNNYPLDAQCLNDFIHLSNENSDCEDVVYAFIDIGLCFLSMRDDNVTWLHPCQCALVFNQTNIALALLHQHFNQTEKPIQIVKEVKEILKAWFDELEATDEFETECRRLGENPNENTIHRIILLDCYGYTKEDLNHFNIGEDVNQGNMSDEGLERLKLIAEKAEKWRRRRNYAMFLSCYSKIKHVDVNCHLKSEALVKFLGNQNVQFEVASYL